MAQNTTDDKFFRIQFQYCYQFVVNCDEFANRTDVTDHQFRETMKRELRRCLMDCEKRKYDNTIIKGTMAQTRMERLLILKESVKDCMAEGLNMGDMLERVETEIRKERES